jgi:hypothetical protein
MVSERWRIFRSRISSMILSACEAADKVITGEEANEESRDGFGSCLMEDSIESASISVTSIAPLLGEW